MSAPRPSSVEGEVAVAVAGTGAQAGDAPAPVPSQAAAASSFDGSDAEAFAPTQVEPSPVEEAKEIEQELGIRSTLEVSDTPLGGSAAAAAVAAAGPPPTGTPAATVDSGLVVPTAVPVAIDPLSALTPAADAAAAAPRPASALVGGARTPDPDDIVVDSERQRAIANRQERKEPTPLYVGVSTTPPTPYLPPVAGATAAAPVAAAGTAVAGGVMAALPGSPATRKPAMSVGGAPALPSRANSRVSPALASPTSASARSSLSAPSAPAAPPVVRAAAAVAAPAQPRGPVLPYRSWNPSPELSRALCDDWDSHGRIPGEHTVMQIPDVLLYNAHDDLGQVAHSLLGVLFMSSYQLFLEPTQRRDRLGQNVVALPLSTIERLEFDKANPAANAKGSGQGANTNGQAGGAGGTMHPSTRHYLEVYSKDGRLLKLGFAKQDECKRAHDCLTQYVFPAKEEFLFAYAYKLRMPLPPHLNGWNIYDPLAEYARQGINTVPLEAPHNMLSTALRLSLVNENYSLCASYPRVLVVPSERYVSDVDLLVVAQFRSRGRIPVCTWKHPSGGRQSIWRCSQPRVGINNTRCAEDEKLLHALTAYIPHGDQFAIFDARPKFNARANILAGKGFENPELYKNAVKKIFFLDIHNIHVMRDSCAKMVRACAREAHNTHEPGNASFVAAVAASGWLSHVSTCLKATAEMVKALDQDKLTLLVHCSDGWDRTAQLAALCQLCMDPYYRTTRGFFVLVEKEWLSFGHQFARRTGHRDRNHADDQRSCIFLQWLDCVSQLLHQFPRHFEFNSHMLVTLMMHVYSCRFGTFLHNSDLLRRKHKLHEKTVSVWTYLMCSPAALAGEFTNQLYCRSGNGMPPPEEGSKEKEAPQQNQPYNWDEHGGRSSVGRGGGDGSQTSAGTVLYPCWTLKSIRVWDDYFLRWSNEQCEQVSSMSSAAGSVASGGAATPRLYSKDAVLQGEIRRLHRDAAAQATKHAEEVKQMEGEMARLRALLAAANNGTPAADAESSPPAADAAAVSPAATAASVPSSPSPVSSPSSSPAAQALAAIADSDEDGSNPEPAALAALKKRLEQDVDVNVRPDDDDAAEDRHTL